MEDKGDTLEPELVSMPEGAGYVQLPVSPAEFKDFVTGLLGQPQSISKFFSGEYEITKYNIQDLHDTILQRIQDQNVSELIKFTISVTFSDNSVYIYNTIGDFIGSEVSKAAYPVAVHASWIYLIKFAGRKLPEKQDIEISFLTNDFPASYFVAQFEMIENLKPGSGPSLINIRINHTSRTWGSDLEGLLSQKIQVWVKKPSWAKVYLSSNRKRFSQFVFGGLLTCMTIGVLVAIPIVELKLGLERTRILRLSGPSHLEEKINYMIGVLFQNNLKTLLATFFVFPVSIGSATLVSYLVFKYSRLTQASFLLFNEKANRRKAEISQQKKVEWIKLIGSAVLTSVVALVKLIGPALMAKISDPFLGL